MNLIAAIFSALFALGGRWAQLHPHRVVSKGLFVSKNTFGARAFRFEVAALGSFAVFGGTTGAIYSVLSYVTSSSVAANLIAEALAAIIGVTAAIYVRREVRRQPEYVSDTPNGW